jgi:hypothetical protein
LLKVLQQVTGVLYIASLIALLDRRVFSGQRSDKKQDTAAKNGTECIEPSTEPIY